MTFAEIVINKYGQTKKQLFLGGKKQKIILVTEILVLPTNHAGSVQASVIYLFIYCPI